MIAVITKYAASYVEFIKNNGLSKSEYRHVHSKNCVMGLCFIDYVTIDEFDKEIVNAVIIRLRKSEFQPIKTKNLAFPKDNFLKTQMDYDGYNKETF